MIEKRYEILGQLNDIDAKSIRALREGNQDKLHLLEQQAVVLRAELTQLNQTGD